MGILSALFGLFLILSVSNYFIRCEKTPVIIVDPPSPKCSEPCDKPNETCALGGVGACDDSCDNFVRNLVDEKVCHFLANQKCVCRFGYVRDYKGLCIKKNTCIRKHLIACECNRNARKCGPHETQAVCEFNCNQTCETRNLLCKIVCVPVKKPFCICKPGYVRSPLGDGLCLPSKVCDWMHPPPTTTMETPTTDLNCPLCNGPNEICEYTGRNLCADTCTYHLKSLAGEEQICPNISPRSRCACERGFARDNDGICIPVETCERVGCGCNELRATCLEQLLCRQTCLELNEKCVIDSCTKPPAGMCYCKADYIRIPFVSDKCVPQQYCTAVTEPPTTISPKVKAT